MLDDFYIGYEPQMPRGLAARIRRTAVAVLVFAAAVSALLAFGQDRFADGTFEYGRVRVFEGRLIESPYPALVASDSTPAPSMYWLVGPGKHGAAGLVAGRDGAAVRITGSLIERERDRMIEMRSLEVVAGSSAPLEPLRSRGSIVLSGEIVDSKCHLGVMKPGEGPTHRDCAVRCLLGRIAPMFVPRTTGKASGPGPQAPEGARPFWPSAHRGLRPEAWGLSDDTTIGRLALIDPAGRPFDAPLEMIVGRPVIVRGELLSRGPLRFLATTPGSIRVQ